MANRKTQASLDALIAEYMDRNPRSRQMFERAKTSLPGGNTRTGVYFDPFPIYADRGEGVYLIDLDGHRLLDFVNNNTALILGHAHPVVVGALQDRVAKGTGFSRPLALEVEMAECLRERIPSLERVRFCSSGTEAVLNAIRASRAFTGKHKIAKFEGAYHGMDEYVMVSYLPPPGPDLGPAYRPHSFPTSAGLTPEAVENVIVLPFNNPEACGEIITENANDLAAVIVDPLSTAAGNDPPCQRFSHPPQRNHRRRRRPPHLRRNHQLQGLPGRRPGTLQRPAGPHLHGQSRRGRNPRQRLRRPGRCHGPLRPHLRRTPDSAFRHLQRQSHRHGRRPRHASHPHTRGLRQTEFIDRAAGIKTGRRIQRGRHPGPGHRRRLPLPRPTSSPKNRATTAQPSRTTRPCTNGSPSLSSTRGSTGNRAETSRSLWRIPTLTNSYPQ